MTNDQLLILCGNMQFACGWIVAAMDGSRVGVACLWIISTIYTAVAISIRKKEA